MEPFAYGLREHTIFSDPLPVDLSAALLRQTPPAFKTTVKDESVEMLPLVRNTRKDWKNGWCTYTDGFENNPDIEIFCGGENEKTATAAACWRQGNLLHFGFEQSPGEMNENGQMLLLNCISYISQFTEDRPIAATPSVFAGPVAYPRSYVDRRIRDKGDIDEAAMFISKKTHDHLKRLGLDEARAWYEENRRFLHPDSDSKLEIDQEAKTLGAPIDDVEFFSKIIEALKDPANSTHANLLLKRYAPSEATGLESPKELSQWFDANKPYLFFSDQGDYKWYIDPLAKKRSIPTSKLRGPLRASK